MSEKEEQIESIEVAEEAEGTEQNKKENAGKSRAEKKTEKSLDKKLRKAEESFKQLQEKFDHVSDKLLRSHAEFENYRKRIIKEREDIRINTRIDAVNAIVPVLDHFELALKAAEDASNIEVVLEGMKMIKNEFEKALNSLGVEEINAEGKEFDPNLHEAVANEHSEEVEKDIVIKQWRPGYKFQNRLIRPASVVVSAGSSEDGNSN